MRNTVLLFMFCCIFPFGMCAQTEFSQTGAKWKTNYSRLGSFTNRDVLHDYLYELNGDTLLSGKDCRKLYLNDELIGAFLEEEHKVWYYPFINIENTPERVLLYDFSLVKGDLIESYKIPWNTGANLSYFDFNNVETTTLKVEDVYYQFGRKVMVLSDNNFMNGYGGDTWIEGIGSPSGFWGVYLKIPTDGSSTSTSLVQAIAPDKTTLFFKGQIIDTDYQSTFLKEGKTWEVLNDKTNIVDKITIGKPEIIDNYLRYPVSSSIQPGYLYDVNGTIYFIFNRGDNIGRGLDCDHLLYNFGLKVGNGISLCVSPFFWYYDYYYDCPEYKWYNVIEVDTMIYKNKSLKRITLMGDIKHVWLEDVGSLNSLLYINWKEDHLNIPQYKLLRCYIGDEILYDSSDFPDGIEGLSSSVPTYLVVGGKLTVTGGAGYQLSLYDINGREVYDRMLTEMIETISLSDLSSTLLIGKLQKGESVLSFKIGSFGK